MDRGRAELAQGDFISNRSLSWPHVDTHLWGGGIRRRPRPLIPGPALAAQLLASGAPSLFLAAGNRLLRSGCSYCSGETVESNRKTVLDTVTILSVTLTRCNETQAACVKN